MGHEWVGLMYKAGLSVDLGLMYTASQGVPQDLGMMYAEGFPSHITTRCGRSCQHPFARPPRILWDEVDEEKTSTIPVRRERRRGSR